MYMTSQLLNQIVPTQWRSLIDGTTERESWRESPDETIKEITIEERKMRYLTVAQTTSVVAVSV